MAQHNSYTSNVKRQVTQASQQAVNNPWFERLARLGYAVKGVVYILFGLLAARAAFGMGGAVTDKTQILVNMLSEPFGKFLLAIIALGLFGYVLWRFVQALLDPEHNGTDKKGIVKRVGYAFSGLFYAGLALTAARLTLGMKTSNGGNSGQGLVARVFDVPLGRWLVVIAGLVVLGGGLYQLYKAYSSKFSEQFKWGEMSATERTWTVILGRVGLAARGIVQGVIGIFLVQAALLFDPSKVQGSNGALASLSHPPFGLWTVGVVAIGLAAYGIYMLAAARYMRFMAR